MDSAALTELNLRLADACRVEHYGKMLLEAIASDASLPRAIRERAELHWIETRAQLNQASAALELLAPALARNIAAGVEPPRDRPGTAEWAALERREISAYQSVLARSGHSPVKGLTGMCAAAIDLQRSVLLWLEAGPEPPSRADGPIGGGHQPDSWR